jgi:20S proteasome alpha/beta subunit
VAATATNGVVVATEKKVSSPLVDDTMVKKIAEIDKHVGMVYSGAAERHLPVFIYAVHLLRRDEARCEPRVRA